LLESRDVAITAAKAKLDSLKGAIEDMKMKKAMAEMTEMASGMITSIGGAGDTLDRLQGMVEEERNKAAGRARLAKDSLDMSGVNLKEAEQQAMADQALADFAAKEGIVLDAPAGGVAAPTTTPAPATKTMGPGQTA
jgi:phage shock protein A